MPPFKHRYLTNIRDELHACIAGIVDNQKATLLKAGSVADHVHLLIVTPCRSHDRLFRSIQVADWHGRKAVARMRERQ